MEIPEPTSLLLSLLAGMVMGGLSLPHCFCMCGPLHLAVCLTDKPKSFRNLSFFNLTRIACYSLIGFICGFFGSALNSFFPKECCSAHSGSGVLAYLFPGFVLVFLSIRSFLKRSSGGNGTLDKLIGTFFAPDRKCGAIIFGCAATFLPCGILYIAFATAVGTGSPLLGVALLFSFSFTITFFLQLGVMAGSLAGRRFSLLFDRLLPWGSLLAGMIYVGLWLLRFWSKHSGGA